MKFRCCEHVFSSFMITNDTLAFCPKQKEWKYPFLTNYNGELNFSKKYIATREEFIQNFKENKNIPKACSKCAFLKEKEWDENSKITLLGIANRTKCSCNCIYCLVTNGDVSERKKLNNKNIWNIKPVLEELEKNNLLSNEGKIYIAGGECSEYPKSEINFLINFAFRNNFSIEFASSGMFYSEEIANALKNGRTQLLISPDSGTKETYEKIKRVKYFDKVWNNIEKYINAAQNNDNSIVTIKYIILNGINDNLSEFKAFLEKCNKLNCQSIYISVELNWLSAENKKQSQIPEGIQSILQFIKNLNDKRIKADVFIEQPNIKTSARVYSYKIEESIRNGNIILNIPTFAAKEETYKRLTNTNMFEEIWNNIKKYSDLIKLKPENSCNIVIQYKILLGINDSIDELNELIEKCNQLDISSIEFNLSDSHINNDFTKDKIESLKNSITHINAIKNMNITFDSKLTDIINNI